MSSNKQIVKNASQGYGYSYSNLADLAKAGVEIPVMKTQRVDGDEYVFALIDGEWIQGAKVIEMEMKGMNAAQAYGSALTYARRLFINVAFCVFIKIIVNLQKVLLYPYLHFFPGRENA